MEANPLEKEDMKQCSSVRHQVALTGQVWICYNTGQVPEPRAASVGLYMVHIKLHVRMYICMIIYCLFIFNYISLLIILKFLECVTMEGQCLWCNIIVKINYLLHYRSITKDHFTLDCWINRIQTQKTLKMDPCPPLSM